MASERSLEVALAIARHLCDTAFEHDGRCSWLGAKPYDDTHATDFALGWQTVGPELYGGTSGIALFLAEVAVRSGDQVVRRAAAGGIRHALSRLASITTDSHFGFFTGPIGIAYSALRVGWLLGLQDSVTRALDVLSDLARGEVEPRRLDVFEGAAGAAPALLLLARWTGRADLRDLAIALGDRILEAATRDGDGSSWLASRPGDSRSRPLTGLSRGAAGFGWSLIELFAATGDARFRDAARDAARWENARFRPDRDNWPDLRDFEGEHARAPCAIAWSHGAPGIGLARLRALEIDACETYRRDAEAAVRAAKRALRAGLLDPELDCSLCHGRAGVAEFLLRAGDALADEEARDLALGFAVSAAARYAGSPEAWPCDVIRGSSPGLMPGLAGIGYFYLRLADPGIPSPLLVGPGQRVQPD